MTDYLHRPTGLDPGRTYRVDTGASNGTAATITRVDPKTTIDGSTVRADAAGAVVAFLGTSATLYLRPLDYAGNPGTAVTSTGSQFPTPAPDTGAQTGGAVQRTGESGTVDLSGATVTLPATLGSTTAQAPVVSTFTANGTWTVPTGAKVVRIVAIGGGSGGGSGRRGAAGTVRGGGSGAAGACMVDVVLDASTLGLTSYPVVVGTGGAGGAAVTADSTDGNVGSAGTDSSVGSGGNALALAMTSTPGNGGTTAGGAAVAIKASSRLPGAGAAGGTGGSGGAAAYASGPGGGGGGAGISSGDAAAAGGSTFASSESTASTTAGGTSGGGAGNPGTARLPASNALPGAGGSGGGSNTSGAGGTGGAGGAYGAGGGGGGASANGNNSGAGGAGGPGIVQIFTWR